jgi:hypothetical protein
MVGTDFSQNQLMLSRLSWRLQSYCLVFAFIFTFLLSSMLCGGEFTATVNRNQIHLGEHLILNLSLKDTSAKSAPSVQALNASFAIASQQQTSNTVIRNGKVISTIGWKITLTPKREGELQIPSITVATSEGVLSSQPIIIQVGAANVSKSAEAAPSALTLTAEVSNSKPYKQEPVFYTIKLTTQRNIANVKVQKIELENAIVEINGEPQSYETALNGVPTGVIEVSYRIIPLKVGALKIPSVLVQGVMPMRRKMQASSVFDDDEFSPFAMLAGFDLMQPFAQMTDEIVLEILPPIPDIQPWIVAQSLHLEESWKESVPLRVGEPFNRSFRIEGEGIASNQLPSLADLQQEEKAFKVYADKPELSDEVKGKRIKSTRLESYTWVPQQAGVFTLPEMTITWWNVVDQERVVTRLPARVIQVLPAEGQQEPAVPPPVIREVILSSVSPENVSSQTSLFFYATLALGSLLLIVIGWGIMLRIKMRRLQSEALHQKHPKVNSQLKKPIEKKTKKEKLPDLNPT